MTAGAFINLVFAECKTEGTAYLKQTDTADVLDLVQEQLCVYTKRTHCLQSDRVVFTPEVGRSVYNTFEIPEDQGETYIPEWFDSALCSVRYVYIEGAPLMRFNSNPPTPGMSSEFEVTRFGGSYLTAPNGKPYAAWQSSPDQLIFNCPFDQVYTNCFVVGRRYHNPITSTNDVIELHPDDIRPAAMLCQGQLLYPYAREKAAAILATVEALMVNRRKECDGKTAGVLNRGTTQVTQTVNLGR